MSAHQAAAVIAVSAASVLLCGADALPGAVACIVVALAWRALVVRRQQR